MASGDPTVHSVAGPVAAGAGADTALAPGLPAREEWRANWPLVLTCTVGMSLPTITVYSLGLFFQPLEQAFSWTRAQISFGLTIYALIVAPLAPLAGAMMDRWGARRIAIPGVILFGAVFASFSLVGPSVWSWWTVWIFIALAKLCITPTVWLIAISSRFVTARGTAMAVALSGTAIASFLSPILARWLIAEAGWQLAYVYMGVGWSGIVLLLVLLFFYDARDRDRLGLATLAASGSTASISGMTFRQAIRNSAFIRICVASFLVAVFLVGTTVHLLPILTLRELSRETAAGIVSIVGFAAALGKIGSGWLFDRMTARPVAAFCLTLPAVPLLILALAPAGATIALPVAIPTAVLLGLATGAELSVTANLATQYVGLRAFGKNYGVIAAVIAVAAGLGPFLAGLTYDRTGDYVVMLLAGVPAALLAGGLMLSLPRPPGWETRAENEPA